MLAPPEFSQVLFHRAQVAREGAIQANFTGPNAIGDRDYRSSWWTSRPTYLWIFIVLVLVFGCWIHRHIHADRLHFGGATRVLEDKHTFLPAADACSYNV